MTTLRTLTFVTFILALLPNCKVKGQAEYLDFKGVKLNGTTSVLTNLNTVTKLFGKPDSIETLDTSDMCVSFFEAYNFAYYKNIKFEQFKDTLVLMEINFENNSKYYLKIDNLKLNQETTLEEIKKYYPNAVKNIYPISESVDKFGIQLEVAKAPTDDKWILIFRNNKLVKVQYYVPC